jgi:uncharacterized protein (TIGR03435 family)
MLSGQTPVWRLQAGGIDMKRLAELLSPRLGTAVVDATGLAGQFDITLEFATDPAGTSASEVASLPTALREQLGLRLERRHVPVEVLVIDRVDLPTPD